MEKNQLKEHFRLLTSLHEEFLIEEMKYKSKVNRQVKETAYRNLESVLMRFENYVTKNFELYTFITSKNGSDFERAIIWDELKSFQYFGRDMNKVLTRMKETINED